MIAILRTGVIRLVSGYISGMQDPHISWHEVAEPIRFLERFLGPYDPIFEPIGAEPTLASIVGFSQVCLHTDIIERARARKAQNDFKEEGLAFLSEFRNRENDCMLFDCVSLCTGHV